MHHFGLPSGLPKCKSLKKSSGNGISLPICFMNFPLINTLTHTLAMHAPIGGLEVWCFEVVAGGIGPFGRGSL